jgi:hypothetical protein
VLAILVMTAHNCIFSVCYSILNIFPLAKNYRFVTTKRIVLIKQLNHMSDDLVDDELESSEELNDDEATLADDLLDEVSGDDVADDILEGFGILPEAAIEEEDEEEKDDTEDDTESLEDDAEDVDFDRFDDIDEM